MDRIFTQPLDFDREITVVPRKTLGIFNNHLDDVMLVYRLEGIMFSFFKALEQIIRIFSASKSIIIIFLLGSADADPSTLLRVELMWYKIDFSAILGGFIGLIIMLIVIVVFSSPQAIGQLISLILP